MERRALALAIASLPFSPMPTFRLPASAEGRQPPAPIENKAFQPALEGKDYGKTAMSYSDYTRTQSGLLYKDAKQGSGQAPSKGDRVVVDWTGYTIGYFGRPFETKKLRELDQKDDTYLRWQLGSGTMIPAFEEALATMTEGGGAHIASKPSHEPPRRAPPRQAPHRGRLPTAAGSPPRQAPPRRRGSRASGEPVWCVSQFDRWWCSSLA